MTSRPPLVSIQLWASSVSAAPPLAFARPDCHADEPALLDGIDGIYFTGSAPNMALASQMLLYAASCASLTRSCVGVSCRLTHCISLSHRYW